MDDSCMGFVHALNVEFNKGNSQYNADNIEILRIIHSFAK